jgi:hypothetical protein
MIDEPLVHAVGKNFFVGVRRRRRRRKMMMMASMVHLVGKNAMVGELLL